MLKLFCNSRGGKKMNFLKDNFKLIFVVSAMVIIGVGTLIYDVNKPSLSGGVANIIKIGDTAWNIFVGTLGIINDLVMSIADTLIHMDVD